MNRIKRALKISLHFRKLERIMKNMTTINYVTIVPIDEEENLPIEQIRQMPPPTYVELNNLNTSRQIWII